MTDRMRGGYARDSDDEALLVKVTEAAVTIDASDVEIGAVEIKDGSSDQRAEVDSDGRLQVEDELVVAALGGTLVVRDDYQTGEILDDQSGAGAVLTFTFSAAVQMVVIRSNGALLTSRADPFGGTPAASVGIRCGDDEPVYLPVLCTAVKVFAPVGTTISVYGMRRA